MRSYGFSLLELLITMAVMSVLLGIGVPSFSAQLQKTRLETATATILESMEFTRTRAVTSDKRVTMHTNANWEDGWQIFVDVDNNGQLDANDQLLVHQDKLSGVTIKGNNFVKSYISYIGTGESRSAHGTGGGPFQAGTLSICPTAKGTGNRLILARGGRVRIEKMSEADCASI